MTTPESPQQIITSPSELLDPAHDGLGNPDAEIAETADIPAVLGVTGLRKYVADIRASHTKDQLRRTEERASEVSTDVINTRDSYDRIMNSRQVPSRKSALDTVVSRRHERKVMRMNRKRDKVQAELRWIRSEESLYGEPIEVKSEHSGQVYFTNDFGTQKHLDRISSIPRTKAEIKGQHRAFKRHAGLSDYIQKMRDDIHKATVGKDEKKLKELTERETKLKRRLGKREARKTVRSKG